MNHGKGDEDASDSVPMRSTPGVQSRLRSLPRPTLVIEFGTTGLTQYIGDYTLQLTNIIQ